MPLSGRVRFFHVTFMQGSQNFMPFSCHVLFFMPNSCTDIIAHAKFMSITNIHAAFMPFLVIFFEFSCLSCHFFRIFMFLMPLFSNFHNSHAIFHVSSCWVMKLFHVFHVMPIHAIFFSCHADSCYFFLMPAPVMPIHAIPFFIFFMSCQFHATSCHFSCHVNFMPLIFS